MGSPETCEKCGGVGRHVEGKRGFTRFPCPNATPTPPGAAPDAASGPKAPPRMPAPADARPMVVGGAFVKFDRPAPADDAGAAEDHPTASSLDARRDHGAEGSDRAVVEALTALRDRFAALITRNPDFGATDWALVEQADAALRGTNQAKRGNDARKGGEGA